MPHRPRHVATRPKPATAQGDWHDWLRYPAVVVATELSASQDAIDSLASKWRAVGDSFKGPGFGNAIRSIAFTVVNQPIYAVSFVKEAALMIDDVIGNAVDPLIPGYHYNNQGALATLLNSGPVLQNVEQAAAYAWGSLVHTIRDGDVEERTNLVINTVPLTSVRKMIGPLIKRPLPRLVVPEPHVDPLLIQMRGKRPSPTTPPLIEREWTIKHMTHDPSATPDGSQAPRAEGPAPGPTGDGERNRPPRHVDDPTVPREPLVLLRTQDNLHTNVTPETIHAVKERVDWSVNRKVDHGTSLQFLAKDDISGTKEAPLLKKFHDSGRTAYVPMPDAPVVKPARPLRIVFNEILKADPALPTAFAYNEHLPDAIAQLLHAERYRLERWLTRTEHETDQILEMRAHFKKPVGAYQVGTSPPVEVKDLKLVVYRPGPDEIVLMPANPLPPNVRNPFPALLDRARELIATRGDELTRPDLLANALGVPQPFLEQALKQGKTTMSHLRYDPMVPKAKDLLANTTLPIPDIAKRSGNIPQQTLARLLKDETGDTPSEYRHKRVGKDFDHKRPNDDPGQISAFEQTYHRAQQILAEQCGHLRTVEDVAKAVGVSTDNLIYVFKKHGSTVTKSLIDVRIDKAKELLAKTSMPISDILKEIGFDHKTLIKYLRRETGDTPTVYRQRHASNPAGVTTGQPVGAPATARPIIDQTFERAQQMLATQYRNLRKVEDLAQATGVSVNNLSYAFKLHGTSVMKALTDVRIEKVKDLLVNTSMAIGDIVNEVGFEGHKALILNFQRATGTTPYLYRMLNRAQK